MYFINAKKLSYTRRCYCKFYFSLKNFTHLLFLCFQCENRNKKIAKQECCLKMVEKLHGIGELDSSCLPKRHEQGLSEDDSSDDEETEKVTNETFDKQVFTSY